MIKMCIAAHLEIWEIVKMSELLVFEILENKPVKGNILSNLLVNVLSKFLPLLTINIKFVVRY